MQGVAQIAAADRVCCRGVHTLGPQRSAQDNDVFLVKLTNCGDNLLVVRLHETCPVDVQRLVECFVEDVRLGTVFLGNLFEEVNLNKRKGFKPVLKELKCC